METGLYRKSGVVIKDARTGRRLDIMLGILWTPMPDDAPEQAKEQHATFRRVVLAKFAQECGVSPEHLRQELETLVREGLLVPWEEPCAESLQWRCRSFREANVN